MPLHILASDAGATAPPSRRSTGCVAADSRPASAIAARTAVVASASAISSALAQSMASACSVSLSGGAHDEESSLLPAAAVAPAEASASAALLPAAGPAEAAASAPTSASSVPASLAAAGSSPSRPDSTAQLQVLQQQGLAARQTLFCRDQSTCVCWTGWRIRRLALVSAWRLLCRLCMTVHGSTWSPCWHSRAVHNTHQCGRHNVQR